MSPIAVSMGDPAGVGLEIAARAWTERARLNLPDFFLIGDSEAFARAARRAGLDCAVRAVDALEDVRTAPDALCILHTPLISVETPGRSTRDNARAIVTAIERGVEAVRAKRASALCTMPIAKAPLYDAGFAYPGHTELIAYLCQDMDWPFARGPVMMLAGPSLRVALVSIHTPLAAVPGALTVERIAQTGRVVGEALQRDFGIAEPRLALAALNPHAGESGTLGREEIEIVNPAAEKLRAEGWAITDAKPADTLFHAEARAAYDAVIALYHDQGLIPLKTLHFWDSANITLGLPVIRTSPDHGVGFDIAGKGEARIDSFVEALRTAHLMASRRAAA